MCSGPTCSSVAFPSRCGFATTVTPVGDRARIRAAVYADLGRRGLACDERPADTLVEDLRLLADPTTTVDLVALLDMDDDKPVTALAATRGRHGILAVQGKLTLRLTRMRGTLTTGALVGLLPATRAAIGNSITQPAAALRADPGRHRRAQPGVVLRKVTPAVAADAKLRALAAVMDKPVRRAGQLGVTRTDDAGRPAPASRGSTPTTAATPPR